MDQYGYGLTRPRSGVWRSLRDGDFEEEDVWDVLRDRRDNSGSSKFSKSVDSSLSVPKKLPTAARMIPRHNTTGNGSSSSSSDSSQEAKVVQLSAPVNIPDWSRMRKKNSKKSANPWLDDDDGGGGGKSGHDQDYDDDFDGVVNGSDEDKEYLEDDDDDGDDDREFNCKVPPHEFIARRLARSHISSFSVFEGVGRTLKGRDLKKVRNAVLIKTGFLESL